LGTPKHSLLDTHNRLQAKGYGGEGGIRTLGTGISQYNGLANLYFLGLPNDVNGLQAGCMWQNRVNEVSFGNFCSPHL
jgi:hypothetical protein